MLSRGVPAGEKGQRGHSFHRPPPEARSSGRVRTACFIRQSQHRCLAHANLDTGPLRDLEAHGAHLNASLLEIGGEDGEAMCEQSSFSYETCRTLARPTPPVALRQLEKPAQRQRQNRVAWRWDILAIWRVIAGPSVAWIIGAIRDQMGQVGYGPFEFERDRRTERESKHAELRRIGYVHFNDLRQIYNCFQCPLHTGSDNRLPGGTFRGPMVPRSAGFRTRVRMEVAAKALGLVAERMKPMPTAHDPPD